MKLYMTEASGNSYKMVVAWLKRCEALPGWLKLD